tara:strand:+ start:40 stop:381 length:342 start_codon:yes stop_codon:yes gene_type:complete
MRFLLIIFFLLGCKSTQFVSYQKPMSNDELARYIRLIEHKRIVSFENYLYRYGRVNYFNLYNNLPFHINRSFKDSYKPKTINIQTPQTGTVGSTTITPNVQPPISNGNIKTKQ